MHWRWSVLISCIVRAHGQTSARYTQVRTTTTTTATTTTTTTTRVPQRLPLSRPSLLIVFKVLPEDRVPPLVVVMSFLFRLVGDARRMRMAVCIIGMCTRATRSLRLQRRMTRMRMRRTRRRRRTTIWTSWMILSLVFPLGSGPCGCAGGSPPGTAGRGGGERAAPPGSWTRAVTFLRPLVSGSQLFCSVRA